jgi:hypothetical protein
LALLPVAGKAAPANIALSGFARGPDRQRFAQLSRFGLGRRLYHTLSATVWRKSR